MPVDTPVVTDLSGTAPPPYSIKLDWSENLAYLVTNTVLPGSYKVYYRQNLSGPPYDGIDAGNGVSPVDAGDNATLTLTDLQPSIVNVSVPLLLSAEPRSSSVNVSWGAVAGATDYRVHYGIASVNEQQIEAGAVTSLSVGGLQNGTEYRFVVSALAQPVYHFAITAVDSTQNSNESVLSPESTLAIGPLTESANSNELLATPDDTTPYPDLPDEGCFVATAAFGVDWAAEVQVLRDFRDRFLVTNRPGRAFVHWYYLNGPTAATLIAEYDAIRPFVRALLWPLIVMALFALAATPLAIASLLMLGLILVAGWPNKNSSGKFRKYLMRSGE